MLSRGIICTMPANKVHTCLALGVVEGSKTRLILDGSPLSPYVPNIHFKMKSIADVATFAHPGMLSMTWDHMHAFYQNAVDPRSIPNQCFAWKINGKTQYYAVLANIMGRKLSPLRYHKRAQALIYFLNRIGLDVIGYLDDQATFLPKTDWACEYTGQFLKRLLNRLHLIIRESKSGLDHGSELRTFLGYIIDLKNFQIHIPAHKREELLKLIRINLECETTTPRKIAQIRGKLTGMRCGLKIFGTMMRNIDLWISRFTMRSQGWDTPRKLTPQAIQELLFWGNNLNNINAKPMNDPKTVTRYGRTPRTLWQEVIAKICKFLSKYPKTCSPNPACSANCGDFGLH
jgi:hypothetical protein